MSLNTRADTLTPFPKPFNWPPSSKWDGVDGRWSTFQANVGDSGKGDDGQNFRLLISTHASGTYLPSGDVCGERDDPAACNQDRGIEVYLGSQSDGYENSPTWDSYGRYNLGLGSTVDYGSNADEAQWGYDTIGLGVASSTSPMLTGQPIGLLQPQYNGSYFMGMFGLSNLALGLGTATANTFLSVFRDSDQIPSLSYSYTAGAYYANGGQGIAGSLVLGGYDESRFNGQKRTEIQMQQGSEDTSLVVGVQAITAYNGNAQLDAAMDNSEPFLALIDSTLPYLWLPESVCDKLEQMFDLEYNNETELYTARDDEQNSPLSLEFRISSSGTSPQFVNIRLPYAALNLDARWPLVADDTKYFPLKRSKANSYVLGRSFLQEAYLIVDYESHNFTVAQAVTPERLPPPSIQPIFSKEFPSPQPTPPGPNEGGGLGAGAIAGIVVGAVAAIVLVLAILFFRHRSQKKKKELKEPTFEKDAADFMHGDVQPLPSQRPSTKRRASELEDAEWSRSSSAQGYYWHRQSNSGSNMTELVGSPPLGSNEKNSDSYFTKFGPVPEPAPLAELPADDNIAELGAGRPKGRRKRSTGSGSNLQSPQSERPDPIEEESGDHATPPAVGDTIASPMSEDYKDAREEITTEASSVGDNKETSDTTESTNGNRKSTERTSLIIDKENVNDKEPPKSAPTS